ncbi:oligosaccharide flippase family protein [Collinsella intestinalis]|uniref:oligosaccharide flippase family protein n=1 Tax=Collinsella intestinalis TaxID=147207 RepID=UPI00195D50E6|nr:oligosaccharide flippase family protein [Collinsella intestinalis]MBM6683711.1 oligosaccharide flippase family protein [Collinsella intestinalis]
MSGYRTFAKNVGVLTIANFGTRLLSFLLVPLYTSILTTADYGTYDLVYNTVSVLIPIFTSNIVDAVLRFSIDENADGENIIGIGLKYFAISIGIVCVVLIANAVFSISAELTKLSPYIVFMFATQALSQILLYYARGVNRFTDVAISSVLCSATIIASNIVFLVILQMNLTGYFLANFAGPAVQIIYLMVRLKIKIPKMGCFDRALEREMVFYSRPLIANSIAWWINNVSDRYIVTAFCGVAVNGVYSVASKIPSILSVFQTIISQAWTISAVDEFDPEDKRGFFSNVYSLYNCVMVVICSLIIALDIPLARLLYANDFFEAWRYVPFLTIAIVFGALAGFTGGILAAVRDSKEFARSSTIGAVVNIALNILTVPIVGPLGSAAATAVSYWLTWLIRIKAIKKYIKLKTARARDGVSYIVLVLQGILLLALADYRVVMYTVQIMCVFIITVIYSKEIRRVLSRVNKAVRG